MSFSLPSGPTAAALLVALLMVLPGAMKLAGTQAYTDSVQVRQSLHRLKCKRTEMADCAALIVAFGTVCDRHDAS